MVSPLNGGATRCGSINLLSQSLANPARTLCIMSYPKMTDVVRGRTSVIESVKSNAGQYQ